MPTDAERALRGRLGGYVSWGNTVDRSARTAPGRAAFEARFLTDADGDPDRAAALRKAYYTRLALKSAKARRAARNAAADGEAADRELEAADREDLAEVDTFIKRVQTAEAS